MIGAYVTSEEHAALVKEAKRRKMTVADLLRERIREHLSKQDS